MHEFLSCLLLSLDEDINFAPKFGKGIDSSVLNKDQSQIDKVRYFKEVRRQLEERDKSIVTDMFQGIIGDCITCRNCKKPKYKYETELMISLPLSQSST